MLLISRADLTDEILNNDRVCGRHFVSGQVAKAWDRYNVDWVPTLDPTLEIKLPLQKLCTFAELILLPFMLLLLLEHV